MRRRSTLPPPQHAAATAFKEAVGLSEAARSRAERVTRNARPNCRRRNRIARHQTAAAAPPEMLQLSCKQPHEH